MSIRENLIVMLQAARIREQGFVEGLTPAERTAQGHAADWSPKDLIAHLADWRLRTAGNLEALALGEAPPDYPELDAANAIVYQAHRAKSWDDVLRFSSEAWDALEQALEGSTEETLTAPSPLPSMNGRPVWRMVVIDVATHPVTHLAGYLLRHGHSDEATRWEEENARGLEGLDPNPAWRGTIRYNLACHYALRGESSQAVVELSEALRLNPDLADWSKQDSDLDSLRGEPGYQEIYEGQAG